MSDEDDRCKEEVWGANSYRAHQCTRKAKIDGYCKQHHPDAQKARDEKRRAKFNAEMAAMQRRSARDTAETSLMEAVICYEATEGAISLPQDAREAVDKYLANRDRR